MKLTTWRDDECADLFELSGDKWLFHTIVEWRQLFGKWNWFNCHFVLVHFMKDVIIPGYEFEVVVLGLGFRLRINGDWNETEEGRELLKFNPTLKETQRECPFCDGTGKVTELSSGDE